MAMLYRYDENGVYSGEIEQVLNPMYDHQEENIDKGYYDSNGNPPLKPVVGENERAIWVGNRYSIEPKYIAMTSTTSVYPGENPEGRVFDGNEWH
ncbi:TPA: hypothetical protein I9786_002840 [Serratia marcescens]|nr:hypothetical protein [Serratia marcescens]HAT5031503.1 hypothetical protein [Serratia marcescens]